MKTITPVEADALLRTGQWVYEEALGESIREGASEYVRIWMGDVDPSEADIRSVRGRFQMASALTLASVSRHLPGRWVSPLPASSVTRLDAEILVGPGLVVKVKPTLTHVALSTASLVCGFLSLSLIDAQTGSVLLARAVLDISDLIKSLLTSWERITDSNERLLLEALCALHGQYAVQNYDALRYGNYSAAYAQVAPTWDEVYAKTTRLCSLAGKPVIGEVDARSAFDRLVGRGVVEHRGDGWAVAF